MIQETRHALNHEDQSTHNEEIMNNVDRALTKHLTYLLYLFSNVTNQGPDADNNTPNPKTNIATDQSSILRLELALTCDALESIYRATSEVVGLSFRLFGPKLLSFLISVVRREMKHRKRVLGTKRSERPNDTLCKVKTKTVKYMIL